ncbi:Cell division inhibitor [Marinobacterium lacunae]|uniref:Cell division inhibitor n=1 Tax=Marinobacterium lacunae TaxID=1232683 RepID=A0A081FV29_9GAMM|nr:TIGR01777 family oxidoreductase [Marinobacterium lacunae]KEA62384.1 Cell division inhibitor [Marinobacterium lacunae]
MRVLITGGTGFIGRQLVKALLTRGDSVGVLSRRPESAKLDSRVQLYSELPQVQGHVDAVVNLAGAPIADRRWSEKRKALLMESRITLTEQLVEWMRGAVQPPAVLISGSAIGYYGSQGDRELDEKAATKGGFAHDLCALWEAQAMKAAEFGVRVCCIRTGVVLGPGGGALAKMLPAFRLGLGGAMGTGRQWMAWIHRDDEVAAILHLLDHNTLSGAFNLTAPSPVTNEEFSKTLASVLNRPAFFRVPAVVLELMMGEASELVLKGQRVVPTRLLESGFRFRYTSLKEALTQVVKGSP